MNKKISPTIIGAFVVGAVALVVIAMLVFGSGRLFRQSRDFVLYFDNSVNGLRVGAPVKFRGVEVGSVRQILLQLGMDEQVDKIPVIIEIDLEKLTSRGARGDIAVDQKAFQRAIVDRGLRGQLQMESLVTGLLHVGLDFLPGTEVNLVQQPGSDYKYQEIPTTPTTLEVAQDAVTRIINKLEEIDVKGLVASLSATVEGINKIAQSPELQSALKSLDKTMPKLDAAIVSIRHLAGTVEDNVKALGADLQQTSAETRLAMKQAAEALKQADETMKSAEAAVVNLQTLVDPDSPVVYELGRSLKEVSAAARSLRSMTGYLERNPRALIFGRPDGKEN